MTSVCLSADWCGLNWSPWIPFDASLEVFKVIPTTSGLYRTRPTDKNQLSYIGQTSRSVKTRLRELVLHVYQEQMPWNDPHTAAPGHWALWQEEGMTFECSGAAFDGTDQERLALEDMLLWRYRIVHGTSTLCNHGRFHARYARPSSKASGRAGKKLPRGKTNPASGPSAEPLQIQSQPFQSDWMGLHWTSLVSLKSSNLHGVPDCRGLYKILDSSAAELLYVGQTKCLKSRLRNHAHANWEPYTPIAIYTTLPENILDHQLHELETCL